MKQFLEWLKPLHKYVTKVWYLPTIALLTALDFFILIIPTDLLLVLSVLLNPRSWLRAAVIITAGSSLGALALAALVRWDNKIINHPWFTHIFQSGSWTKTEAFLHDYGVWALGIIALSPAPQQPSIVIAALAGIPLVWIFGAIFLGRLVKNIVYAWLAAYAPKFLSRLSVGREAVQSMEAHRKGES